MGFRTANPISLALIAWRLAAQTVPAVPPVLTTTRAAHLLDPAAAARHYPLRLRGIVTYYDAHMMMNLPALFLCDPTGCIFTALAAAPAADPRPGDLIEAEAVSAPGGFAPIAEQGRVRILGHPGLPAAAPRVELTHLLTGAEDSQLVEVEGVVRSTESFSTYDSISVALGDGSIAALAQHPSGLDYAALIDSRVVLRGNAAPVFNAYHQITGAHLFFAGAGALRVVKAAPRFPFMTPITPIGDLLRFTPGGFTQNRVHVRGTTTLFWPGRVLCIEDGDKGICAQTQQSTPLTPGETADIVGFAGLGEVAPKLTDASFRPGNGREHARVRTITPRDALSGDYDLRLVRMRGTVIGQDHAAQDPTMLLSAAGFIFPVALPESRPFSDLAVGSLVDVTGICAVQADSTGSITREGQAIPKSFRIMLRTPGDVSVIGRPSWWSAEHVLWVLALAMGLIVLIAGALFRQVRRARLTAAELRREARDRRQAEEATRRALEQMEYQAHHDSLTGLANRAMLDQQLQEAVLAAERGASRVALLFLNLDRFKAINDSLGHAAGDILLREAAERLRSAAPPRSLAARLGGDEFALLIPGVSGCAQAGDTARRINESIAVPFTVEGMTWRCPATIGLCVYPDYARGTESLRRNADTALYRAKRTARGSVLAYEPSMTESGERSIAIEKALYRALETGGFSLAYQPQFRHSGELCGFEALLRLTNSPGVSASAAELVAEAGEIGLMPRIGEWVLREACRQWVEWNCGRGAGQRRHSDICMAVNVAASQLSRGNFPDVVREILAETGMPAHSLALELCESAAFRRSDDVLPRLRSLGVRLTVDNFGAGYGSLGSLHTATVDRIKIDRSFVRDAASSPGTLPFIRTVVSLAGSLGIEAAAGGVENASQREAVKSAGCSVLQGFLFSPPLSAREAENLLSEWLELIPPAAEPVLPALPEG